MNECSRYGDGTGAGMKYLACTHAARAALHMCDPNSERAIRTVAKMEESFQKTMELMETGLRAYDFDYNGKKLPGYITYPFKDNTALYIVIGGGDTFREDLYFFGASEALRHGYNVLMVDLPGQGKRHITGCILV